jgi:O-antigen/teichoic acid export membrane protein
MAWAALAGVAVNLIGNYLCYPEDLTLMPRFTEWRRICGFGVFATGGYLLQELSERMPDIVVGRFLGFESAGLYSRGNGFVTLFQQALMNAIIPVANSALALLHRADEDIRQPFLRFVGYTTAVAWPVLGLMSLLTLPIIQVAFGRQWLGAVPPARIFCLAAALLVLARASLTLFSATGAVKRLFGVQCVSVPVEVAAIIVGSRYSIQAAAAGTVVSGLILAGLCLHNVNQLIGTSWRQIATVLGHSLLLTLGTLALPVAITISLGVTSSEHLWLGTGLAGISGIISWLSCIWGTRHPLRDEMITAFTKLKSFQIH